MTNVPCLYVIVCFSPFIETGQFANVGIVTDNWSGAAFFDFKLLLYRYSRVTRFFEHLNPKVFRETMRTLRGPAETRGRSPAAARSRSKACCRRRAPTRFSSSAQRAHRLPKHFRIQMLEESGYAGVAVQQQLEIEKRCPGPIPMTMPTLANSPVSMNGEKRTMTYRQGIFVM